MIQEAGIPIDMVGGVSIGSLMSGLYSMERNIVTVTQKAREWSRVKYFEFYSCDFIIIYFSSLL